MSSVFGDFDDDDAVGTDDFDPEAVARHYFATLHAFDGTPMPDFDALPQWQRDGFMDGVTQALNAYEAQPATPEHELAVLFWLWFAKHDPTKATPAQLDNIVDADLRAWIVAVVIEFIGWCQRQGSVP
jgi:hypothetical protein